MCKLIQINLWEDLHKVLWIVGAALCIPAMDMFVVAIWAAKAVTLLLGFCALGGVLLTLAPTPFVEDYDVEGKSPPFNPWFSLVRGLFSPVKSLMYSLDDDELPPLSLKFRNVGFEPALQAGLHALRRKSVVDKSTSDGSGPVPFFYLEVVSFAQFIVLMTHSAFPFALLGSVHARTKIRQDAPLHSSDRVSLTVRISGCRAHRRGTEVDFEALAYFEDGFDKGRGSGPVWSNLTTVLFFHKQKATMPPTAKHAALPEGGSIFSEGVPLAFNAGFAYAALCQDYNPIHLWGSTARLFGFRSAIVHGMCLVEKCLPAILDVVSAARTVPQADRTSAGDATATWGPADSDTVLSTAVQPLKAVVHAALSKGLTHLNPAAKSALLAGAPAAFPAVLCVNFRKPVFLPSMPRVHVFAASSASLTSLVGGWAGSIASATAGGVAADASALCGPAVVYEVRDEQSSVCVFGTFACGERV
jgi:acyl dehydratase